MMIIFDINDYFNNMKEELLKKNYYVLKNKGVDELLSILKQEFGHNNNQMICQMIPFDLLHKNEEYEILNELKSYERLAKRV